MRVRMRLIRLSIGKECIATTIKGKPLLQSCTTLTPAAASSDTSGQKPLHSIGRVVNPPD